MAHVMAQRAERLRRNGRFAKVVMDTSVLGKTYQPGEIIIRQGEPGDCMYVIQAGQVAVVMEEDGQEMLLRVLGKGDFFGEMAVFEQEVRSATVYALGPARVLTVDRRNLLRQISEDPTLAFSLMEQMSARLRSLSKAMVWLANDSGSQPALPNLIWNLMQERMAKQHGEA